MSSPKETDFFLSRNDRDLQWYQQCFSGEAVARGETSPNYTKYPGFRGVPERMHRVLPDARLLYLVRDPIKRAVSGYVHNWVKRRENKSFEKVVQREGNEYIRDSKYYTQIIQFLGFYSYDDVLVIESERLRENRLDVLEEVFEFIGVDPSYRSDEFWVEHHKSSKKVRPSALAYVLTHTKPGRALKKAGKMIAPRSWIKYAGEVLWQEVRKPTLSPEVEHRLRVQLRDDVEKLRKLTGKSFSSWSL
jgi:hypothetical protein